MSKSTDTFYTEFSDDMLNKYEFLQNNSDNKKKHIYQEPNQMLLRNFISKYTPYENVLLYQTVGVGKTCTSISIAEGFKEYVNNMGRRILVLVKNKNIQKNYMDELLSKCTAEEYLDSNEYEIYSSSSQQALRSEIVSKAYKTISKSYEFITYGVFVNKVLGIKEFEKDEYGRVTKRPKRINNVIQRRETKDSISALHNTVIIVDEAHNITNNDIYVALMKVLEKSYNYRLILLTATPIYDNITEIFELSNLLNANNPNLQLPIRKQIEKSEYIKKDKTKSGLKGNIYQITEGGKELLNKSLLGKVSYLQANTETNPKTIIMGSPLIPNTVGTTNVVFCKMSKYQYNVYKNAVNSDLNVKEPIDESSITEEIHNIESDENILENEGEVSKTSSLYKNSSDASTMTYPDNTYGKGGFSKIFTKGKLSDPNVLTTDLHKYSSKLYNLLKNINNRDTGNVFIYSNYVSFGGTSLIKALLLANGFYEYSTKRTSDEREYKSFVVFDQNTKTEKREKYKRIFNSVENKDGKLIRILIGSPIMSEGITLKAVRQVHILEPTWNMSRINQIIGRAVRNYSHHALEPKDRTVEIYKYVSIYESESSKNTKSTTEFFIDKEKYILSEEKDRSNKIVERLLKEISFDCDLNKNRNININGENGSPECDYQDCKYTCTVYPKTNVVDKSTYNMYINFFDQFDIYFVFETIKDLFKQSYVWGLQDIIYQIQKVEKLVSKETIFTAINYIIENKVNIIDKYGRDGFLINRGPYYILNSSDVDIDNSIYTKTLDFSVEKNKYTLRDFSKEAFALDIFREPKQKDFTEEIEGMADSQIASSSKVTEIQDINKLTDAEIKHNEYIEQNFTIYGTYRTKKDKKTDHWDHKYGRRDTTFRLVDVRTKKTEKDQRKIITGKAITSYDKNVLNEICTELGIPVKPTYQKSDLANIIKKFLEQQNRIMF
jgi:superfamily II DNA or RNA helicase